MGPRRRLWVVLYREDRQGAVTDTFHGLVVQVFMPQAGGISQGIQVNGKAMVLGSDFNLAGGHVHDRQVGAMVAERQLHSLTPQGKSQQLVSQADAEDRFFAEQIAHGSA